MHSEKKYNFVTSLIIKKKFITAKGNYEKIIAFECKKKKIASKRKKVYMYESKETLA